MLSPDFKRVINKESRMDQRGKERSILSYTIETEKIV